MKIGDLVASIDIYRPLRSGCEMYHQAVVASMDPFVLVSEDGDMRWSVTVKPESFTVVGIASDPALKNVVNRINRETFRPITKESLATLRALWL